MQNINVQNPAAPNFGAQEQGGKSASLPATLIGAVTDTAKTVAVGAGVGAAAGVVVNRIPLPNKTTFRNEIKDVFKMHLAGEDTANLVDEVKHSGLLSKFKTYVELLNSENEIQNAFIDKKNSQAYTSIKKALSDASETNLSKEVKKACKALNIQFDKNDVQGSKQLILDFIEEGLTSSSVNVDENSLKNIAVQVEKAEKILNTSLDEYMQKGKEAVKKLGRKADLGEYTLYKSAKKAARQISKSQVLCTAIGVGALGSLLVSLFGSFKGILPSKKGNQPQGATAPAPAAQLQKLGTTQA